MFDPSKIQHCDSLFVIEDEISNLTPEMRLQKRRELAGPILDAFHDWVFYLNAAPRSLLGKAVQYTRKYWPYLLNCLQDGRLAISSNRAERSIKPFVTGRNNFLFANVPRGSRKQCSLPHLADARSAEAEHERRRPSARSDAG